MTDPLLALLPDATRHWARTEPVMARLAREHPPSERSIPPEDAFAALVTSITHQQVSIAAGRAIMTRLTEAVGGTVTPRAILDAGEAGLRTGGMSGQKTRYLLDLAARVESRDVDLDALGDASDEDVIAALTRVKGIGVWTAKMFLLFHLNRPDVCAHEDLGLQIAVADAYGVTRAEAPARMQALAPAWSPYASVAALVLWHWRHLLQE